jgi:TRAP-type mannitol/chloroaromatic compound transport system permease large subunit
MSGGEIGLLMISLFIITILLGFPIVFTLMGMAVFFGYYAYATPDQLHHVFSNRIFDLLVQNTFSILSNDTLTAVPLFLFMGYLVERANILDRLFYSIQIAARVRRGVRRRLSRHHDPAQHSVDPVRRHRR